MKSATSPTGTARERRRNATLSRTPWSSSMASGMQRDFCHARKEMRTLAAAKMKSVVPTGHHFNPDPKIVTTVNEDELFDYESITNVVVQCDAYLAKIVPVHPLHPEQVIIPLKDGGCELRVKEMPLFRLQAWIMRQCGRATVEKTKEIRLQIRYFASNILRCHAK